MGVIDYGSAWKWINELPNTPPDEISSQCHNCIPLYEEVAARVIRALQLPLSQSSQERLHKDWPRLRFMDFLTVQQRFGRLYAQLDRIKRISGLYAESFQTLDQQLVQIPFVGSAAFASNVVRWEVTDLIRLYCSFVYNIEYQRGRSDAFLPTSLMLDTLNKVIVGNAVVFVEVFAIFDFCIRHFQEFGKPLDETAINDFEQCLKAFIAWWDRVQPGNRMFPDLENIEVDRKGLIRAGILDSLRAQTRDERREASTRKILFNEQNFTLQQYMYDKIDWGPYDPLEIGLVLRGYRAAAKFTYNQNTEVDDSFIIYYDRSGWISEAADRYPYTIQVVSRFDEMWYENKENRSFLRQELQMMTVDARGY
ncbi:hypothetical protein [Thalassospira sp. TSL5-1]|uniref:hypothetical protein n=1 Tax=Thalassospira sp. TSL5-1 TaxID=1544451 RepID=UPI00093ABC50|nr:hypothetical protein [Thalassospira sp. TSL5-1]OKH89425.1 hypothetical protein LF95_05425 [Thalassospira sp. TSL5-1]